MPESILSITNLVKDYKTGFTGKKSRVLSDVSFDVRKGEVFGFVGPNGAGKTTTFKSILGFVSPTEGKIELLGKEDAKLLAGGHSLLPLMKLRLARPALLVDIGRIDNLSYVRDGGETLAIGALTRHHDLATDPLVQEHCPLLSHTVGLIGDAQVRHRGTIGGSIAHGDPASDLPTVLAAIVEDATTLLGATSGDMLFWERERDTLRVVAVAGLPGDLLGYELAMGEGLSSEAIREGRTVQVDDYATYPNRARALERYRFGSVLCAPLLFRGEAIGALNVHTSDTGHRFAPGDADLLQAFAGLAAIGAASARIFSSASDSVCAARRAMSRR